MPFVTRALLASGARSAAFELLAPGGLALLALLVPLVVLYILKIKRNRRRVASTWLWAAAQRDLMAKAPFKRLVAQVPLFVQAAALAALALAFARPATRGRDATGDHVAIVVDASASMTALAGDAEDPAATRLDLAKRAARDVARSLAPGSDALVIEAGREARLRSPLDRDMTRVRAAIDAIGPRDVEGDLGAAVALAVDRLRQLGGARRVVVITDGNLARPDALSGAALPLEVVEVGAPVDNAAIVRVDVRSGTDPALGKEQVQGFLVIANFGARPRDLYVTMREENASDVLASRRVAVGPGERVPVELGFYPAPGDYKKGLIFELSPRDAMPVDDVAYARVPAGDKLPAYLAGASPWLGRALASDPMVDLHAVAITELAAGAVEPDAFVAVDGACPDDPPGGDLLVVHPPPGRCLGAVVGPGVDHPEITSWERADPRMRFLTLDGVHVARANLLDPEGAAQRLVNARRGTLVADVSTSARTATLVGFDVGDSDWPLRASFVLFVRNLLEQARAHRAHGVTGPARTGEAMRVSLPRGAERVEAVGPDGAPIDVSVRGGLAILPDIARAGFYRISWQGKRPGSILVPANLTSAAESDLSQKPLPVEPGKVTVSDVAAVPDAHREWSWLLALGALALVVFDVWYLTRDPRLPSPVAAPAVPRPRLPDRRRG